MGRRGPVLGVTALPASTPITQSVEEFIIDSVYSVFFAPIIKKSVDIFSLGEIGKNLKVEYLRNANPQYDAVARDCSPRRPLPGDDVILPRPLPVCMQMRSKGKTLRSNISGTERDRRKILSPHDPSPQPLQMPPYHLYLRFRVWGSEPQNPKFTFFDRNFFFVSRILSYLLNR